MIRWIVALLAAGEAGWMAFDGARGLTVGHYFEPGGQLGPWSAVVSAVGVEPRSRAMMTFFAVYGVMWLALAVAYLLRRRWAPTGMLVAAIGALWYLPVGTLCSMVQVALLSRPGARGRDVRAPTAEPAVVTLEAC